MNQARTNLWYAYHFGQPFAALQSTRERIDRLLIPSTYFGIQPMEGYAPNGLQSLYDGILRLNPLTPYRELFERKAASYRARWTGLSIRYE